MSAKDLVFIGIGGVVLAWILGAFSEWDAHRRGYRAAVRDLWAQKFDRSRRRVERD